MPSSEERLDAPQEQMCYKPISALGAKYVLYGQSVTARQHEPGEALLPPRGQPVWQDEEGRDTLHDRRQPASCASWHADGQRAFLPGSQAARQPRRHSCRR